MLRKLTISGAVTLGFLLILSTGARAGTPFGGDDTGWLPPGGAKGAVGKCESANGKAIGKYVSCIIKCHDSRASGKLADAAAEETCETTGTSGTNGCLAKYNKSKNTAIGKGGCPSCLDWDAVGILAVTLLDYNNQSTWCASPSGAYLDGSASY